MTADIFPELRSYAPDEGTLGLDVTIAGVVDGVVIHVAGEIDLTSVPTLDACLAAAIDGQSGAVTVDLAAVTFCDSSGLNALVRASQRLREQDRTLVATNPNPVVAQVMTVSGTSELLLGGHGDPGSPTTGE
jgi:anti-anti-sigma factor